MDAQLLVHETVGEYAATLGVTHLEDIHPTPDDLGVYTRLADRCELSVRISTAIERRTGVSATVLSDDQEARLAFVGASRTLGSPLGGNLAVVDVGGNSTEIAVGSLEDGVIWSQSFRIGSGFLADSYLHSDPLERAVASGGSATSLRRMAGAELSHDALERAIRVLASAPAAEVAERFELDPERVTLLPAGVLILEAVGDALGTSLKIGNGGIREGVVLELAAMADED